jgi:hypothetical protein|tara:strand:+ start:30 stop:485 length:456 start_codon:yes stop_codon:yes gene_type:complete
MVGQYLKNGDNQYAATRDDATRTWRILDLWNAELATLGPDDDVPDDSAAVQVLTEGAFIALVKEAGRTGAISNNGSGDTGALEEELLEASEALNYANAEIKKLEASAVEYKEDFSKVKEKAGKSESFLLKERAMDTLLRLTLSADIDNLSR